MRIIYYIFFRERNCSDSYCDVIVDAGGQEFIGHRCILAKFSTEINEQLKTSIWVNLFNILLVSLSLVRVL